MLLMQFIPDYKVKSRRREDDKCTKDLVLLELCMYVGENYLQAEIVTYFKIGWRNITIGKSS